MNGNAARRVRAAFSARYGFVQNSGKTKKQTRQQKRSENNSKIQRNGAICTGRGKEGKRMKNRFDWLKKGGSVLLALLVWQGLSMLPRLSILLASPVDVILRLGKLVTEAAFWATVGYTFLRIALGFFIALAAGILLAVAAGRFRWAEILLWPWMLTIKSVPVASFVIIILIFFGAAELSAIISALMVLPIIYTNTLAGIRAADPAMDKMARVFGLSPLRKLLYVRLPQIRPYFLSGCSVALGLCWKSGVAAELIGQPTGSVGNRLYLSKIYLETADLFAWTLVIILVSFLFEKAVLWVCGRFFDRWEALR